MIRNKDTRKVAREVREAEGKRTSKPKTRKVKAQKVAAGYNFDRDVDWSSNFVFAL